MGTARVVVAEDDALLRSALTDMLRRTGHDVVGVAGDLPSALEVVRRTLPDCVVCDLRMPPGGEDEGLRLATAARAATPAPGVLVISQYAEPAVALRLLETAGAGVGYAVKDSLVRRAVLADAVARLIAGATVVDRRVVDDLIAAWRTGAGVLALTAREHALLALVAEGRDAGQIAARLELTEHEAGAGIDAVLRRLGLGAPAAEAHRRVVAVLRHLQDARPGRSGGVPR